MSVNRLVDFQSNAVNKRIRVGVGLVFCLFGRTCQCPTFVTEKIGGPQAGRRLEGCSSCAKCSTEREWGEVTVSKKSGPSCALEIKRLRIDLTKEEDYTGLRMIYLDRSGPKLNEIQAQLESPTPAS